MDRHRNTVPCAENFDAWELWQEVQSCWEVSMAGITGLRLADVRSAADAMGIEWTSDLLRRIRILESHTLERMHKK